MKLKAQNKYANDIIDYLKWRGDILIDDQYPINEVDSLILARSSYLPFNKVALAPRESFKSLYSKIKSEKYVRYNLHNDIMLVEQLSLAPRFQNLVITDYEEHFDVKDECQFVAITIHLPDDALYLSFIGTDVTLIGWKEDFNMLFLPSTPAQAYAKAYLERIASKYQKAKLRLGGHSKGGNVAMYAALTTTKDIQDRIISIDNYDGPGFLKDFISQLHTNPETVEKIRNYTPQGSMVGRMLQRQGGNTIVYSMEDDGPYQHDIYSWEIEACRFKRAGKYTVNSNIADRTFEQIAEKIPIENRKIFVDTVYDIVLKANFKSMDDIRSSWLRKLPKIVSTYRDIEDPKQRELIVKFISEIITFYRGARKENIEPKAKKRNKRTNAAE